MLPQWLVFSFVAMYGLVGGSFITAWLWRIKTGESVVKGRSVCTECKTQLKWYNLVPFFSYVVQKGRCTNCKAPISIRYPIIEVTTAILFIFVFNTFLYEQGLSAEILLLGLSLVFISISAVLLFFYDLFWMILPNQAVKLFAFGAIFYVIIDFIFMNSGPELLFNRLLCSAVVFIVFFGLYQVKDGKYIGGGDVKLLPLLGLILSFNKFLLMMFIASVLGSVVGITLIFVKKRSEPFAFGPFLLGSFVILLLYGDQIVNTYNNYIFAY